MPWRSPDFFERTEMSADPLSDVLSLLQPSSQFFAGFDAAGDWAFDFPAHEGIKFTAVMGGGCWGRVEGENAPFHFEAGDCFLLNSRCRFVLASDPEVAIASGEPIIEAAARQGVVTHNGGGETFLISGRFAFPGRHAAVLFDALPPLIHVPRASGQAGVLRWALDQWANELHAPQPGAGLMSTHLAHLMLVQVLRLHLATPGRVPKGWFLALTDSHISLALGAMHAAPAQSWTLESLARIAGVSRTVFAQRFKALVGHTAMDYLSRWRMLLAADRLSHGADAVSSIAFAVGYESESAFSTAFKRIMGQAPAQYRRQAASPR
ncbi:AraC family transcriptional regulator [Stenotrophomonas riyadhensis]|uniref:AraC family transcriptional regulator n=1 Tax=Stenotrophomonas riyadhensis TaxID=2859893 RepID=UPI003306135B